MLSKATATFVRISPRKARYVIDPIRRKSVTEAWRILSGSPRRASGILIKLLAQAVDAAQKNHQADPDNLYISRITADGGPVMKRFRAMSMGRAGRILKRTSHISLELDLLKREAPAAAPKTKTTPQAARAPKKAAPAPAKKPAAKAKNAKKLAGAK